MSLWKRYSLRIERKRYLWRAARKKRELSVLCDRTAHIQKGAKLVFMTIRNEQERLPYVLHYYRDMGITHFLIVDNNSTDASAQYLTRQQDVSLWQSTHSYKAARFGVDWMNALLGQYGHGHWCLTIDPDELFVYPFCDTRPLAALTDWLEASALRSFPAMLLDLYPKGPLSEQPVYRSGQNPLELLPYFDSGNYIHKPNPRYKHLWIQGGVRLRHFFAQKPTHAPALNKIPLVKWERGFAYASSTHMLLPRGLNQLYDRHGGERPSGCLLHTKFLSLFVDKAQEELHRRQHYAASGEYIAYAKTITQGDDDLWCPSSTTYEGGWQQLETLGLISRGGWA